MTRATGTILVIVLLGVALTGVTTGVARPARDGGSNQSGHLACTPGEIVDNEDRRIQFHGQKGQLQDFEKNDANEGSDGMYQYKTISIEEQNGDNETIEGLDLERAHPQASTSTVEQDGNDIVSDPLADADGSLFAVSNWRPFPGMVGVTFPPADSKWVARTVPFSVATNNTLDPGSYITPILTPFESDVITSSLSYP